jgi:hypothetical protein
MLSGSDEGANIPKAARVINSLIALVSVMLGVYHLTQPEGAWRSGLIEIACAILLIISAYILTPLKAISTNLVIAAGFSALGVRHVIHGGGWRSGFTELAFAVLLIIAASIICKHRRK